MIRIGMAEGPLSSQLTSTYLGDIYIQSTRLQGPICHPPPNNVWHPPWHPAASEFKVPRLKALPDTYQLYGYDSVSPPRFPHL